MFKQKCVFMQAGTAPGGLQLANYERDPRFVALGDQLASQDLRMAKESGGSGFGAWGFGV